MGVRVKRKTLCIIVMTFSLLIILLMVGFLFENSRRNVIPHPQDPLAQSDTPSSVPTSDNIPPEDTQTDSRGVGARDERLTYLYVDDRYWDF